MFQFLTKVIWILAPWTTADQTYIFLHLKGSLAIGPLCYFVTFKYLDMIWA